MRAVILAAGRGARLSGVIGDRPKCLARVGSTTILERQLRTLCDCGVSAVTVVVGHQAAEVRAACSSHVSFVHNAQFASTNSLYSLWLAREQLADGFLVLNGDVVFHRQLLEDLLAARYDDALLVAARCDRDQYTDEEMKVVVRAGLVADIAKTIAPLDADGENVGIGKFSAAGAATLIDEMDQMVAAGATCDWLPAAFARFSRRRALHVVDSRGFPWIEIDFPEDYWRACSEIAPVLDATDIERARRQAAAHGRSSGAPRRSPSHV